jgi:DNA-binding NtrC family response regulator
LLCGFQVSNEKKVPMPAMVVKPALIQRERKFRLLVIDADDGIRQMLSHILARPNCELVFGKSPTHLDKLLTGAAHFDVLLIDVAQAVNPLLEILPLLKSRCPETKVICIAHAAAISFWLEAIQRGAYEYLPKPLHREDLRWVVDGALERLAFETNAGCEPQV